MSGKNVVYREKKKTNTRRSKTNTYLILYIIVILYRKIMK